MKGKMTNLKRFENAKRILVLASLQVLLMGLSVHGQDDQIWESTNLLYGQHGIDSAQALNLVGAIDAQDQPLLIW